MLWPRKTFAASKESKNFTSAPIDSYDRINGTASIAFIVFQFVLQRQEVFVIVGQANMESFP